ncbi:MFS transporter [Gorillibacterium sp. sgz5001074]|uniref:MFS transporter n=1 Tax=Gorillibacterium sp. sgz5001074 TaxID=3446695 RepID=UPI003F67FD7A
MSSSAPPLQAKPLPGSRGAPSAEKATLYGILFTISLVHLLNDSMQSVFQAILPILEEDMNLSYLQVGFIIFGLNVTSSIMQPVVGLYTDKKPSPFLLPLGMVSSFFGMLTLAFASSYWMVILAVVMVGLGSAVFHPEGSRVSNMAAGSRRGLAQSIFQVGGNAGQALGPIMTALIFVSMRQFGAIWFTLVAGLAIAVQWMVAHWYKEYLIRNPRTARSGTAAVFTPERKRRIRNALILLVVLVFARSWYGACISNFYQFYLKDTLGVSIRDAQYYIFCFGAAGALGTFCGGPLGDRFGRKNILFFSMLGSAPFALLLPYTNTFWAYPLLFVLGFILLSSFSVTVVYAQELVPGKIGTVSGLITGLAFGMGALGSVALGAMADWTGITFVMQICSFLPLLGLLTVMLPADRLIRKWSEEQPA